MLSLLGYGFNPQPRNFYVPQVNLKKKKKKSNQCAKSIYLGNAHEKLISHGMRPLKSIHVVTKGGISFFLSLNHIELYGCAYNVPRHGWKQTKSPQTGE